MNKTKSKTNNYKYPLNLENKKELYEYLDNVETKHKRKTNMCSVYYLIEYEYKTKKIIEPIYFMHYKNVYFPSPCELHYCEMKEKELKEYVLEMYEEESLEEAYEYENIFQKGNTHYEIYVPQCAPFLPEKVCVLNILSEEECLEWLLSKEK